MRTILNLTNTFTACLLIVAPVRLRAAGEWLASADTARLHCAAVNATTGEPLSDVAIRVLGLPVMRRFDATDVKALDKKLNLFGDFPVLKTNAQGTVTLSSPLLLDFCTNNEMNRQIQGYIVANRGDAESYASYVSPSYWQCQLENGYKRSWGKVLAAYLPALYLDVKGSEPDVSKKTPAGNVIGVEGTAPIVRPGEIFDLKLHWDYVKMPLSDSQLVVTGAKAVRETASNGPGRVHELWTVKGVKAVKEPGRHKVQVFAHLDAPRKIIRAASIEAHYYVAANDKEKAAYQRLFEAERSFSTDKEQAIETYGDIATETPDILPAWINLTITLGGEKRWEEILAWWEKAPARVRENAKIARTRYIALENLGPDEKAWDALVDYAKVKDGTAADREDAYRIAVKKEKYAVARKVLAARKSDMDKDDFERDDGALRWLGGDHELRDKEAFSAARGLYYAGKHEDALEAIRKVDFKTIPAARRALFYDLCGYVNIRLGRLDDADKAIENLAAHYKVPREKLTHNGLLASYALARGDFDAAFDQYVKAEEFNTKNHRANPLNFLLYARAVQKAAERIEPKDGAGLAAAAFTLLAAHKFTEADLLAKAAVTATPDLPGAHLAAGLAREMSGDLDGAVRELAQAASLAPANEFIKAEHKIAVVLRGNIE